MENSVVPSNEMEANQPANPESDEGHNQHEEAGTEHVISISDSLEERFRTLMDSDASLKEEDKGQKPLIGHVPMLLGMESELNKYFKPRIVSIGPVHHGEEELEQGQQYKLQLAKLFFKYIVVGEKTIYNNILKEIESFKNYYDQQELLKKFHGNDEDLAWMFFVDGCSLIQFVIMFRWMNLIYFANFDPGQVKLMATDLILLDNQLPFGLLNLIMKFSDKENQLRILILYLAEDIMVQGWTRYLTVETENHMLELIWMNFAVKKKYSRYDNTKATPRQFRSVKDLQAAGIILEPDNSSSSLRDISFNRGIFFCKLKIPRFRVSEQGKFLVFNLIAFEMHPNFDKDRVVTSYISFLNSLIVTKEDVAELRKAGILFNYLSNDEEVLNTFRELTSSLKPYPNIFSYTNEKLINYFNDKKSMTTGKWLSEAMHVYFRSPWTTITFVSATFLLILTIIQTIFSVLAYAQSR